tara:strand:- start:566 stop:982 length:417 start_codon:yes stop_codon:yes gene_type:complete
MDDRNISEMDDPEAASEGEMYEDDPMPGLEEGESDSLEKEGMHGGSGHDDEILEINEADLVKELRRMKVKMHEARKAKRRRQQNLQEYQLKAIIDQEVKNVLKELNLNSGWIYGKKKPTRSKKGYVHQGSFLKGIGFR